MPRCGEAGHPGQVAPKHVAMELVRGQEYVSTADAKLESHRPDPALKHCVQVSKFTVKSEITV